MALDPNCGSPPHPPGNDGVIKNCALREGGIYFKADSSINNQKGFVLNFTLWRTAQTQQMNNCICNEVLPNEGLFVRVTAKQDNGPPAIGKWYNNLNMLQSSNEFPFYTNDGVWCKFLPLQNYSEFKFYANFFRGVSLVQCELEVVEKGNMSYTKGVL